MRYGPYDDIDPGDIDPETGRPYAGYSSPSLDTGFHDNEMDVSDSEPFEHLDSEADDLRDYDDDDDDPRCSNPGGHEWPRVEERERCLCIHCGADGDA